MSDVDPDGFGRPSQIKSLPKQQKVSTQVVGWKLRMRIGVFLAFPPWLHHHFFTTWWWGDFSSPNGSRLGGFEHRPLG